MLISHKLKIIYIKSRKVAGSSFEAALKKYFEPDFICPAHVRKGKIILADGYDKKGIYGHVPARKLKRSIPEYIWDNYLKVITVRCPYDVYISSYYYRRSIGFLSNISFEQFVDAFSIFIEDLHHLHDAKGKILIDFIIRFEHLDEDIGELERKIDCPGLLETFQRKTNKKDMRPPKTESYIMYSKYPHTKQVIDERCQRYKEMGDEFFTKYWPAYKTKLEESMSKYKDSPTKNINTKQA